MNSCEVENLDYDVKTLINLFFKDPYKAKMELKPSVYLEEMSLSFEERINSLSTIQHRKVNFPGYIPSKYFTIIPSFILIQSFSCDKPHVVMLELKCIAKAMKSLTLITDKNPVFTVECTSRLMSRIAPGMNVKYKVTFLPSKEADYYHEIKFETEDESFRVPILALKSRPLLDFPDHIDIPPTPVKITGQKTFILRNIGKAEAVFCLECSNGLFMVEPDKVRLQPGNLMTITLKIFSAVIGVFTSSLKVILETGEELSISVEASTVNSNIFIDEKRLVLPEVFMTLRERRTIKLVNNSDNLVHFSWQKYASLQEDLRELERLKQQMKGVEELESARCNLLEYHEIINAELHSSIYKRIYNDEIMLLGSENLNFQHENFKIIPLTGEVWPGSSTEIMIIFEANKPLSAKLHAYCECTGIEERLELIVEGKSVGPDLKINLSVLNISKVPLSAEKTFEILAKNYGDIPGNLEYVENDKVSKAKISCTPRKLYLLPGETKAFFINLCSISRGEFMEELKFEIMESKEEIDFVVLGEVLLPNIYFDRNEINFGNVPLGFPLIETVHLKNNSLVAIPFSMSVPQDGFEPALTCKSVSQSKRRCSLPQNPKEFAIEPSSGVIGAGETKTIKITFTPNKYRVLSASLVLELHVNSEAETSSVKLSANAISPMIIVVPENITNPFCFINYEYRQKLTLRNISSAPGYFHILPQEIYPSTGLVYSISEEEVMINALQVMEIEVTWNVTKVGKHVETVKMLLFGEVKPEMLCELHCSGQGPLVTLIPNELHFGRVQLLTYQTLTVELINDSPIDGHFSAVNNANEECFVEIDPESGILEMNSKMILTVGIRLYDSGNVTQKILINIKNGRQLVLTINAKGYGTSIVITPSISPIYNLGKLASNKHYTIPLRTTNYSTKLHTLYWSNDMKCKIKPKHEDSTEWKNFKFDPCKIDISPQKSAIVNLHVFSESDGERSEQFYLFAAIENQGARFILNKVLLKVDFIHRGLELSKSSLHFRIDITPDRQTLMNQTQTIIANNKTDLTILSKFQLKRPFLILDHQQCGTEDRIIHFEKNSSQPIEISFSPATGHDSVSTVFKGTLRISYRDIEELIILSGEINYPNIELSGREINFGTVQPFSSRSCDIMLINDGVLPAFYFWEVTVKSETIMTSLIDEELLRKSSVVDCKPSFYSFSNDCGNELNTLNINPSFGQIEGHNNLRTTFTFFPCYMRSYVIEASCRVIGGRSKTLTIFGGSAQVQYSLEPRHVDFGFRSFNEMHRQNITITNLCEMELHVTTNKNLAEHSEALLNSGMFVVSPTFQKIAGLSSATIQVTYYPKICQELRGEFIIQVNSANPMQVEVKGYGTLPQVIISNPCKRTIDHEISIATFYPAISWLTSSMFASLWKRTPQSVSELQESSNIIKDFTDDWVLITHEDEYPSVEDIELALERILTYIHLSENGLLDSKTPVITRSRPYLEISTLNPEYVIDFGKVVVDSVVDENILIKSANMLQSNPQVSIILPFSARALKDNYNVVFTFIKDSKNNGGVNILNVKLKPDRMTYSSKVTTLNLDVFVVVKGGLKIPLRISAVITIPFLTAITKNLNFLEILVGEEKILSLLIKNEGFIPCEWMASLKFMHRPSAKSNPFSLESSHSGYLEPSEDHVVDVSFRPEFKGKYDYSLIFEVKQNSEPIKINLQGCAIEPNLHISNNYLAFPTVCPNVEDNSKIFIVENRSSFPVEVFFPDYDRFCRREESAVRLLCTIYSTGHLRLLPDHFGTSLSTKLLKSLHNFLVKIKMFLSTIIEDHIAKSQTQNVSNEIINSIIREEPEHSTDEIVKIPEKSIEEKLFEELEKITEQDPRQSDVETLELENLLKDFISLNGEKFHELLAEHDPLQIYEQDRIDMKSSNENLKSCPCLIIFHGAPKTDFQYWANKTARLLKNPAKTLDRIIVDALISGMTPEARSVKLTIEENYSNQFESQALDLVTEQMPFSLDPDSDSYYELIRKIDALIWLKNRMSHSQSDKRAKSTSPASTPKNKTRQKTASKFSTDWGDTLLNINLSLLREIVFQSINKEENGLVIETLSNKFIGDPIKALIVLLTCQDVNERLHFVSLFTDYKTWKSRTGAISKEPALHSDSSTEPGTPQLSKKKTPSSVRKETKKTSSAKSLKKQKLQSDNQHSTEEALLENSFENYGVELSSFMFLLGSWMPMANSHDSFEKKFNNILSAVRKVFPSRDGKKSDSQKQKKSSSKEQGKFNFFAGFSSTSGTSPGVNIWILDSKKNNLNNVQNFIQELILMKKNIDTEVHCEPEDPFCKKAISLIMKKPDARQIHDHTDKGFSLISERHFLSNNDELSVSPSISDSLNNVEEIASKKLKGFESKLKKSKRRSIAGKKKGRKSVDPLSKSNDLNDSLSFSAPLNVFSQNVQKESTLIPRVLLEPGTTHIWQMVFEPQNVGSYKDAFDLQVARGRKLYQIKCSGKCDLPSVNFDPARVFSEVADSYVKAKNKNMIYLRDIETFSFGSLFVKSSNNSDDRKANKAVATLKFVNDSELDVEMNLSYNEESDEILQTYSFEPKSLSISKSFRKTVSVWAHPMVPGEHEMTLICSIKDNPQSQSIKMSCIGVTPEVQFLPPVFALSHVLIGKTSTHNLLMSNKCDLPIIYEVTDAGSLIKGLFIRPENGVVKEQAEELVSFEYTSTKVEVIKAQVEFKFFENRPTKDFLLSKSITFNVECYEVFVDVIFPKKGISSVDFGIMKIDEKSDRAFSLKNKGKFGIGFEIDLVKVPGLNVHPREFLSVEPKSGTILSGKMLNLKVICSCSSPVSIVNSPVLMVRIMELHSNASQASVLSIPVTVKSFYSSFKISPNVAINFGPMLSDSEREMQLQIENTGLFDFKYAIFNPQLADDMIRDFFDSQKKSTPKSKKASSKKSSSAAKTRNKAEHLEIEPFIIKDSCGSIKPGSIANLKVICKNPRLGDCVTDVMIKIGGSNCPEGLTYKLLAYGCSPQVDISNLDAIFQESHLLDEFNPNSFETTLEPKITFSKSDSILVFYNTLVGSTANINLHFSNTDRLPSDLSFEVTFLTDVTNACFTVYPMKETIGPLSTKLFTVSFKPRKFEIVTGEAVITTGKEVLKIKLVGEGVLPQLEIVKPLNASKSHAVMLFEPTLLSYSTVKGFTLRNAGKIRCKVVIEELNSECKIFHWRMLPETHGPKEGMKGLLDKIEADFKSIIILDPLEERDFEVEFLPDTIASFTCTLKLLLVNNPYESFSITMIGSGYQDDVVIRDLTRLNSKEAGGDLLTSLKIVEETDSKFLAAYSAEYGAVYIGQCREKCFQISNLSNDFYRFEWADHDNMTLSPNKGFVYPNCCEEICMTFYSEEPITPFFKMPVMCSFTKVECNDDGVSKELSSELNSLSRNCDSEVVLEPLGTGPELEFTTIEGTSQQIAIIASGVVDSPVPFSEINSITFPETLLFQISERSFDVTNNSYVPLIFEWRFKDAISSSFDEISSSSCAVATRVSFGTVQPRFNKLFSEATGPSICRRKTNMKPSTAHNSYCAARPLPSSVSLMKRPSTAMNSKEVNDVSFVRSHCPKQPFSITSMSGIIEAKETVSFQLSFAPVVRGIHSSLLHLRVKGLTDGCEPLQIALHGTAVSPVCHLLVATSDCLETGRHRSGLSLEPRCKAIEFEALGSTHPITKSFDIVNTTANPYRFILKQLSPPSSPFSCLTSGGQIEPFKQVTLSFVLFPQESGIYESLWHLEMPDLDVIQPLLIIGNAREPSVSLSSSHVYMQPNFVGVPVSNTVSLLNNENIDLHFKIFGPKDTVRPKQFGDGDKHLKIKPSSGSIKAHSQVELICTILPDKPGEDVVLLKCQVEKCREPLLLHIHTSAFNVHPRISYVTHQNTVEELSPYTQNFINMNKLTPRIPSCIQFAIANVGQLPITYGCGYNSEECRLARTEIYWSKKHGSVAYRDEHKIELNVIALSKISFKYLPAVIQVNKGPTYKILLSGSAESAIYEFSFKEYDFGHCLIAVDGSLNDHTANLLVTNKDEDRIIIEVVSPALDHFKVFVPNDGVLKPRESIAIRLSFTPVEPKLYSETVEFLINGVDRHKIVLSGEGHYLQISLADPHQKCVDFGSVLIGREVKKALTLVNNSKVTGEISLMTSEGIEPPFSFEPSTKQTIGPLARKDFVLNFSPNEIIPAYSVQLLLSIGGKSEPICLVKGKAMGAKISSDRDFVTFGCVVLGCAASMKLVVHNEGDIGSHFNWEHTMPTSWFKITPSSGFLPGKSSNTLLMTFSPEEVIGFIQKQVTCYFDSKYGIKPLIITITGSCVSVPPPTDTLNFKTSVRTLQTKSIDLRNPSEDVWTITPLFSGEFFRGSKQIIIDPYDVKSYDIIYEPLTMTADEKKHEGTVFFPFLDGSCKLFKLIGMAGIPESESSLEWSIPCKTNAIKSLDLKNWLPFPQRFKKDMKLVKSSIPEPICTIESNLYTEVGSLQKRPYTLKIFCYQECSVQYEFVFHNETSSEYIWYSVSIKFEPCPILEIFTLKTRVRQDFYLEVSLVKELPCSASFCLNEVIDYIHIEPLSFNAGDEAKIAVRYYPLLVEDKRNCRLEIVSRELGKFVYSLTLSAIEPILEEAISISTEIGSSTKFSLTVMNNCNESCTFSYKNSHPYFKCEKHVVAKAGQKVNLEIEFEPTSIGKIMAQLEVSSEAAGIFRFPVTAYCTKPTPKGPLYISSNKNTQVKVKNVFGARQAFTWTIDNENFIVRTSKQNVKPSEQLELAIGLKIQSESTVKNIHPQIPITGKLVISCEELNIDWIFYLRNDNGE